MNGSFVMESIKPDSRRDRMMQRLLNARTSYVQHYEQLVTKYATSKDILIDYTNNLKQRIHRQANDGHYKYQIYLRINPDLIPSPFLHIVHPRASDVIKFRLGSHYLPIETGRWSRKPRSERLCTNCGVLGDEEHVLYHCTLIKRDDVVLQELSQLWLQPEIYKLFTRIKDAKFL
jgi:hypothetical protein